MMFELKFSDRKTVLETVAKKLGRMGGLPVKLIQFVSLRTEIFTDQEKLMFIDFFDQVPIVPLNVGEFLVSHLSPQAIAKIVRVEPQPVASGSFAQVYRGWHADGTELAIKIKRPHLKSQLKFDFLLLNIFSHVLDLFLYQRLVDIKKTVREFERLTYFELDYQREASRANYFYQKYLNHQDVVIPYTYLDLCSQDVIVQQFVTGIPLTHLIHWKLNQPDVFDRVVAQNQIDMERAMITIVYEMYIQGAMFEYYYADPHPGNVQVLPGGKVVFLDFGLTNQTPVNRKNYFQIIQLLATQVDQIDLPKLSLALLKLGARELYEAISTIDYYSPNKDKTLLNLIVESYAQEIGRNQFKLEKIEFEAKENFSEIILNVMKMGDAYGVKIPADIFAIFRSVLIYKSYHQLLVPGHHPMRQVIDRVIKDVQPDTMIDQSEWGSEKMSMEQALEIYADKIASIAEVRPDMFEKINQDAGSSLSA